MVDVEPKEREREGKLLVGFSSSATSGENQYGSSRQLRHLEGESVFPSFLASFHDDDGLDGLPLFFFFLFDGLVGE